MPASPNTTNGKAPLAIDRTVTLPINGSTQRLRMCATRAGLPPILIVQAGPGFPLLNEVKRFQRRLGLESDFLVCYWEQRGCGPAPKADTSSVSMQQQVDDLRAVLQWVHTETKQTVIVFGISLGGAFVLQAVEHESARTKAVIAISTDTHTERSDAFIYSFLHERATLPENRGMRAKLEKLGKPPYTKPAVFQQRAGLVADMGGVEYGKKFSGVMREVVFSMVGAYGVFGTAKTLRNMNAIQDVMLSEMLSLDLLANPPRVEVPVHYLFGEQDPLVPPQLATLLPGAIAAPSGTVTFVQNAGHMVHFDQPEIVRSVVMNARIGGPPR